MRLQLIFLVYSLQPPQNLVVYRNFVAIFYTVEVVVDSDSLHLTRAQLLNYDIYSFPKDKTEILFRYWYTISIFDLLLTC